MKCDLVRFNDGRILPHQIANFRFGEARLTKAPGLRAPVHRRERGMHATLLASAPGVACRWIRQRRLDLITRRPWRSPRVGKSWQHKTRRGVTERPTPSAPMA